MIFASFPLREVVAFLITYAIADYLGKKFSTKYGGKPEEAKKLNNDVISMHISFLHSLTTIVLCIAKLMIEGVSFCEENTYFQQIILSHSIAYFLHDIMSGFNDYMLILHHLASIIVLPSPLFSNYGASEVVNMLLFAEASGPFFQLRVYLRLLNLKSNLLYTLGEIIFAAIFVINRLFIGFAFSSYCFMCQKGPIISYFGASIIMFISSFWIAQIFTSLGMKFVSKAKSPNGFIKTLLVKIAMGLKSSLLVKIIFHGSFLFGCGILPYLVRIIKYHQIL